MIQPVTFAIQYSIRISRYLTLRRRLHSRRGHNYTRHGPLLITPSTCMWHLKRGRALFLTDRSITADPNSIITTPTFPRADSRIMMQHVQRAFQSFQRCRGSQSVRTLSSTGTLPPSHASFFGRYLLHSLNFRRRAYDGSPDITTIPSLVCTSIRRLCNKRQGVRHAPEFRGIQPGSENM